MRDEGIGIISLIGSMVHWFIGSIIPISLITPSSPSSPIKKLKKR